MVGYVDHGEEDAQVVPALEVADARVDVLWVEAVVFQAVGFCKRCQSLIYTVDEGISKQTTHLRNRAQVVCPSP